MKYIFVFGLFFVHSSVCMDVLKLLKDKYSPKIARKKESMTTWVSGPENGKEKYTQVDNKIHSLAISLAVDPLVIEQTNEACVIRVENSSDLYDLIDFIEKKLKEIDSKKKGKGNRAKKDHLAILQTIRKRIQGDIATVSPKEIAIFMAYLSYIPHPKIEQVSTIIPIFDCDTSSTVCIVIDQKAKKISGAFGGCINGLYGVNKLYKEKGLLCLANGVWQKTSSNSQIIFDTVDNDLVEQLHKMIHHPFLKTVEQSFAYVK